MARRAVAQELEGIDTYCASQAYLVLNSWRNFPHASRDRAAICRNYLAGSLSDLCWRLPDAVFLPEIPRMDPMAVCGQSHLRRHFVLCVECFGLRFRDFSSAPDLFSGSFLRTASLDRRKVAVILACGSGALVATQRPSADNEARSNSRPVSTVLAGTTRIRTLELLVQEFPQ